MNFLRRLFGGDSPRRIPGVIFSVSSSSVHHQDMQAVPQLIEALAALTAKHGMPHFVEKPGTRKTGKNRGQTERFPTRVEDELSGWPR